MKKIFLSGLALLFGMLTMQAQDVTVVDNINDYTGNAAYVYNKADGKTYVLNNLGAYELYGVYVKTNTLNIADPDAKPKVIDYIATDNDHKTYINTGYTHTTQTRVVADFEINEAADSYDGWRAVFGSRTGFAEKALVYFYHYDNSRRGCFTLGNKETKGGNPGTNALDRGIRYIMDANSVTKKVTVTPKEGATDANTSIIDNSSATPEAGQHPLYIFTLATGSGGGPDNSYARMKLYGFKIYEDDELVRDYEPVVNTEGKGGLYDEITKTYLYSADDKVDFLLSPDAESNLTPGIPVYTGKMVLNTNDNHIYKYNGTGWTDLGTRTLAEIASTDYKNMKNWNCPNDHWQSVFGEGANIQWNEETQTNTFDPYVGTGGWEPLRYVFKNLEVNADYKVTFNYSTGGWKTWSNNGDGGGEVDSPVNLPFKITDRESIEQNNGHFDTDAGWINGAKLTPDAQDKTPVDVDFSTPTGIAQFIIQFGVVDDNAHEPNYWFKFDNLSVKKYNYPEAYPVLNPYKPLLQELITEVENNRPTSTGALSTALTKALNDARDVVNGNETDTQKAAYEALQAAYEAAKAVDTKALFLTAALASKEGINIDALNAAADFIQNGTEKDELDRQLYILRAARKVKANGIADIYTGSEPAEGTFYLYNIGTGMWLANGSDWSTHCAVDVYPLPITLVSNGDGKFKMQTHMFAGKEEKYINWNAYTDTGDQNTWQFNAVEGKTNVYTINSEGDRVDVGRLLGYDPFGPNDKGDYRYWSNVAKDREDVNNVNNQWKLVSEDELATLQAAATEENPVDVSYLINNGGFSRVWGLDMWTKTAEGGNGGAHVSVGDDGDFNRNSDYGYEFWNTNSFSFTQKLTGLTPGKYRVSVNGFFRQGDRWYQRDIVNNDGDLISEAYLKANDQTALLPNIATGADKLPVAIEQEGAISWQTDSKNGSMPHEASTSLHFLETGIYTTSVDVTVGEDGELTIGVGQDNKTTDNSWTIFDTFRLTYLGAPELSYYIVGTMTDWEINPDYKMTLNTQAAQGVTEYMFTPLALTTDTKFKVVSSTNGMDIEEWFPDGINNGFGDNGEITANGDYTIFFRPDYDGPDDWFYNAIYAQKIEEPVEYTPLMEDGDYYVLNAATGYIISDNEELNKDGNRLTFTFDAKSGTYTITGNSFLEGKKWTAEGEYAVYGMPNFATVENGVKKYLCHDTENNTLTLTDDASVDEALWMPLYADFKEFDDEAADLHNYVIAGTKNLTGTENDWEVAEKNQMTADLDNKVYVWTATAVAVNSETNPEFKVVANQDLESDYLGVSYPENNVNIIADVTGGEEGNFDITITFNPATKEVTVSAVKVIYTGINGVKAAEMNGAEVYNLAGQKLAAPAKGLNIINGKKVVIK